MQSKLGFLKKNFAMDVEEFQWPTRLLPGPISQKPGLVERAHRAQYVIPWGIGEYFWRRRLRLCHAAVEQIAARVFGPGRSDASPANANDATMPVGVRTRSSASEAATSGLTSGRRRQHQRNRFFVGINISIRHCALRADTPDIWLLASSGLSESCPKIGDVPKSPVPHIGSPGAVGRHNDASNKEFGSRAGAPGHPSIAHGSLRLIEGQGNSSATMTVPHAA